MEVQLRWPLISALHKTNTVISRVVRAKRAQLLESSSDAWIPLYYWYKRQMIYYFQLKTHLIRSSPNNKRSRILSIFVVEVRRFFSVSHKSFNVIDAYWFCSCLLFTLEINNDKQLNDRAFIIGPKSHFILRRLYHIGHVLWHAWVCCSCFLLVSPSPTPYLPICHAIFSLLVITLFMKHSR